MRSDAECRVMDWTARVGQMRFGMFGRDAERLVKQRRGMVRQFRCVRECQDEQWSGVVRSGAKWSGSCG